MGAERWRQRGLGRGGGVGGRGGGAGGHVDKGGGGVDQAPCSDQAGHI